MKTIITFIVLNILLYLSISFCRWDINWFIHAGSWSQSSRVFIAVEYIFFECMIILLTVLVKSFNFKVLWNTQT